MKGLTKITLLSLVIIIALLAMFYPQDVYGEKPNNNVITRTETTDTICVNGVCTMNIYSGPVNMKNTQGEYTPFTEVVDFSWDSSQDAFNLSWFAGSIVLQPQVVATNGNNYTISELKGLFPVVEFNKYMVKSSHHHKWGLNFSAIPSNLMDKVEYIKLDLIDSAGITWDDVELDKENNRVIFFNKVVMDYSDLVENNFTLKMPEKGVILIGNVANQSSLWLDPTIQLQDANSKNLGDARVISTGPNDNDGSDTRLTVNGDPTYIFGNFKSALKFNISLPDNITIVNSTLELYKYAVIEPAKGATEVRVYGSHNLTWDEMTITWNNFIVNHTLVNLTTIPDASSQYDKAGWYGFNVSSWVINQTNTTDLKKNISFVVTYDNKIEQEGLLFRSKEASQTNERPILRITYIPDHPQIDIISPLNKSYSSGDIDYNITVSQNLSLAYVTINSSFNSSMTNDTYYHWYNLSSKHNTLAEGIYNITFYVESLAGFINFTTSWFTVDTTAPSGTVDYPTNITYKTNDMWFNATVVEKYPSDGLVQITSNAPLRDPVNYTLTNTSGIWNYHNISLNQGTYYAVFFVNDTADNKYLDDVYFTIDAGNITVKTPDGDEDYDISQKAGGESLFNLTVNHTGVFNYTIDFAVTGEINITDNFTITFAEDPATVNGSRGKKILLNITTYNRLPAGNYLGNITWNKTNYVVNNQSGLVELNITVSGFVGIPNIINTSWSSAFGTDTSSGLNFSLNASGDYNLTDCNMDISTSISGVSLSSSHNNFSMINGSNTTVKLTLTSSGVGSDAGAIITMTCVSTPFGGLSSDSVTGSLSVSLGGGSGGGGGGGGGASCGNGYCEVGEDPVNCPQDCEKANWTYGILPSAGTIAYFVSPGALLNDQVSILNPNPENLTAVLSIECDGSDPSCQWLWLLDDELVQYKTVNVVVEPGTLQSPSREDIKLVMDIPKDIELKGYRSIITFNSFGVKKTVTFELLDTKGFGVLGWIIELFTTEVFEFNGNSVQVWMIVVPFLFVVSIVYVVKNKRLRGKISSR